jgi:predicted Zn-dependent peptidase
MGDYRALFAAATRVASISAAEIQAAARTWLVSAARTVVIAEPDGSADEGDELDA